MPGRRTARSNQYLLAICWWMLILASRASGDDKLVREAFSREYQPHVQKLLLCYTNINIRYSRSYDPGNGKKQTMEVAGRYNLLNYHVSYELGFECRNSRYFFELEKKEPDKVMGIKK